jgi:hypothetical protein
MGPLRRAVAALAAVAAGITGTITAGALTASHASAVTAATPAVGVQFHATWSDYTSAQRIQVLDELAAAHIGWVRVDVGWQTFEEAGKGQYSQWYVDLFDSVVNAAQARGIKVLATLWATPAWANGNKARNVPPTNPADYADIARWAATHYRGRVAAWEVWNEPNLADFWSTADPAQYAAVVKAAYPAFKAGDPAATVVAGVTSANDDAWLARMYQAGAQGSFDVLATHPYQGPSNGIPELADTGHSWILDHLGAVHALMVQNGDGNKPIWATELGWSSHPNTGTEPSWKLGVTEAQQADYTVRTIQFVAAHHPYVTNLFFYTERNQNNNDAQEDNYGILNRDLTPKPVYTALQTFLATTVVTTTTSTTVAPTTTTTAAPTTTTTAAPTTTTTAPTTTTISGTSGTLSTTGVTATGSSTTTNRTSSGGTTKTGGKTRISEKLPVVLIRL